MQKVVFFVVFVLAALCMPASGSYAIVSSGGSSGGYGGAASQGAQQTVKEDVEETLENAREVYDEMSEVTFEETIPKPEDVQEAAESCLEGILNADFGFGLNLPSISSLLNQACEQINSEIMDHLDDVNVRLSNQFSTIGLGLGGNLAPRTYIDYDQVGDDIADSLWEEINRGNRWQDY